MNRKAIAEIVDTALHVFPDGLHSPETTDGITNLAWLTADAILALATPAPRNANETGQDEALRELREFSDRATLGPWQQIVADDEELLHFMKEDAAKVHDRVGGLIFSRAVPGAEDHGVTIVTINARRSTLREDEANAALIVAAVNYVRAALATQPAAAAGSEG